MKTSTRLISLFLVLVLATMVLASCATTLSGTYKSDTLLSAYTKYTFSGSKVTVAVGSALGEVSYTGTYEIKDNTITISLDGSDGAAYSGSHSFSQEGDTIYIDNIKYTKQ